MSLVLVRPPVFCDLARQSTAERAILYPDLKPLTLPVIPWPDSWVRHAFVLGLFYFIKVNMNFTSISLLSDTCCGMEGKESPSEQNVSVEGVSQDRNPKGSLSAQKDYPCDMCDLHLKDVLYPAEHQTTHPSQKPYTYEANGREFEFGANLHQQKMRQDVDKPISRGEGRASLVKSCRDDTSENPFTLSEGGKDFVAASGSLQHQVTHSAEEPQQGAEGVEDFRTVQSHNKCSEFGNAFSDKPTLAQHQRPHTEERPYECSKCGIFFSHASGLLQHQRDHNRGKPYECCECGKFFQYSTTDTKYVGFSHIEQF